MKLTEKNLIKYGFDAEIIDRIFTWVDYPNTIKMDDKGCCIASQKDKKIYTGGEALRKYYFVKDMEPQIPYLDSSLIDEYIELYVKSRTLKTFDLYWYTDKMREERSNKCIVELIKQIKIEIDVCKMDAKTYKYLDFLNIFYSRLLEIKKERKIKFTLPKNDRLLTCEQTAKLLKITEKELDTDTSKWDFPHIYHRKIILFYKKELLAFLKEKEKNYRQAEKDKKEYLEWEKEQKIKRDLLNDICNKSMTDVIPTDILQDFIRNRDLKREQERLNN